MATAQSSDPVENLKKTIAAVAGNQPNFINNISGLMGRMFRNRDFFDQADVALAKKMGDARMRAANISRSLSYDLNGDFEVTRDEATEFITAELSYGGLPADRRTILVQQQLDMVMKADANNDGKISGAELATAQNGSSAPYEDASIKIAQALIDADPNHDGKITQTEFLNLLGKVSEGYQDALAKLQQQQIEEQKVRQSSSVRTQNSVPCEKQSISDNAKIAYMNLREGTVYSAVTLVGQDDVTRVVDVSITEAESPLALVLVSANPVIWRFTGATARIEKIITETDYKGHNFSGVVGVPKGKVVFAPSSGCLRYLPSQGIADQAMDKGKILQTIGRQADSVTYAYSVKQLELPSGKSGQSTNVVAGGGGIAILKTDHTGPLVDERQPASFSVDDVVSQAKAETYEVLPQQLGLDQLLAAGQIEKIGNGYRILKKMRFPAGLNGDFQFLIAKDVPKPEGNPGNSCVVAEDTGTVVAGICRN